MRRATVENPATTALRKLHAAGGRLLGGSNFTMAEQAILWDLKNQGRVELVERSPDGLSGWRLVARTPGGASLTRDA